MVMSVGNPLEGSPAPDEDGAASGRVGTEGTGSDVSASVGGFGLAGGFTGFFFLGAFFFEVFAAGFFFASEVEEAKESLLSNLASKLVHPLMPWKKPLNVRAVGSKLPIIIVL